MFGMAELEWCGYPMVKHFENMITGTRYTIQYMKVTDRHHATRYSLHSTIHESDRQTDRHQHRAAI